MPKSKMANRVATAATLAGLTNAQPATVLTHDYDAVGNRISLADTAGGTTWFDHDGAGRLTRVLTPANDTIDLAYDAAGRLTRIANPNAVATQVAYDPATGRPQSIAHRQGSTLLAGFGYGFDTDGKITSIADAGGVRTFTYDATQQVTGGGYASNPETYAYDPEGNRTASHLSASYTTGPANRLIEDADACYSYDANGNLETKTAKVGVSCTGGVTAYSWDVLNRLAAIDFADGTAATYRYDAQGRRIEKAVNGAITRYVYDADAILLEYDGGGVLQARYSHGLEIDQPLSMARGGQSYFYQTDHLGSIRLITDAAGAVVSRYDYDAFGNLESTSFEGVANPYGFTARERDAESGLMFYRARYYDPNTGRFISEDPIGFEGADLNMQRYVWNDPQNEIDPTGLVVLSYANQTCGSLAGGTFVGGFFGVAINRLFNFVLAQTEMVASKFPNASNRQMERELYLLDDSPIDYFTKPAIGTVTAFAGCKGALSAANNLKKIKKIRVITVIRKIKLGEKLGGSQGVFLVGVAGGFVSRITFDALLWVLKPSEAE